MAAVMFGTHFAWQKGFQYIPQESALTWLFAIHIISWIFQIIGHQVFESKPFPTKNANLHFWTTSYRSSMPLSSWWWRSSKCSDSNPAKWKHGTNRSERTSRPCVPRTKPNDCPPLIAHVIPCILLPLWIDYESYSELGLLEVEVKLQDALVEDGLET